jgi:hypothetical protein
VVAATAAVVATVAMAVAMAALMAVATVSDGGGVVCPECINCFPPATTTYCVASNACQVNHGCFFIELLVVTFNSSLSFGIGHDCWKRRLQ